MALVKDLMHCIEPEMARSIDLHQDRSIDQDLVIQGCARSAKATRAGPMKSLFIVNDPPYGTERVYNALRLVHALAKREPSTQVTVFLMADAVLAAKAQQKTPDGYYNIERMLKRVVSSKGAGLLSVLAWTRVGSAMRN
jgi:DsrE/DsrF-like family